MSWCHLCSTCEGTARHGDMRCYYVTLLSYERQALSWVSFMQTYWKKAYSCCPDVSFRPCTIYFRDFLSASPFYHRSPLLVGSRLSSLTTVLMPNPCRSVLNVPIMSWWARNLLYPVCKAASGLSSSLTLVRNSISAFLIQTDTW